MNTVEVQALAGPMSMAERWSLPSSVEDGYLLADPLTGDRIDPARPPIWIEDDAVLAGGLAYLRRNADKLSVDTFFVQHETAADLGDYQKGWYESQVKAADFYGYEGLGSTAAAAQNDRQDLAAMMMDALGRNAAPSIDHFLRYATALKISTFAMRRMVAAHLLGTPSFSMDITADGTAPERALNSALPVLLDHPDRQIAGVAHLGAQNAREWLAVARLGVEVKDKFGELRSPIKGFVTYGAEHRDLQRKAQTQGVSMGAKRLKSLGYDTKEGFDLSGMLSCGFVLPAEMPEVVAVADDVRAYLKSPSAGGDS